MKEKAIKKHVDDQRAHYDLAVIMAEQSASPIAKAFSAWLYETRASDYRFSAAVRELICSSTPTRWAKEYGLSEGEVLAGIEEIITAAQTHMA